MNSLHKDQLKLSFQQYYNKNDNAFLNIDELKRANEILSKKNPQRKSGNLFAHIIKNRKLNYESYTDEYIQYDDFEQRINSFLSENEKEDKTTIDLIFELFDDDKDGLLNVEDLMKFLSSVGSTMEQKQVVQLLELMTAEGTSLTRKEFQIIFQHL